MADDAHDRHELTYRDVFDFLRRGLPFAVAAAIVAALVAHQITRDMPPTFEARSSLLAALPSQDLRSLLGPDLAARPLDGGVYRAAAKTEAVMLDALRRLAVEPSQAAAEHLRQRTQVHLEDGGSMSLLHVDVVAHDPVVATDEANAVAAALRAWDERRARAAIDRAVSTLEEQVRSLDAQIALLEAQPEPPAPDLQSLINARDMQRQQLVLVRSGIASTVGTLEVFEEAVGRAYQVGPRTSLTTALAAIAALIAAYGLMLIGRAFDTRVRSLDDLARSAGVAVLAGLGRRARKDHRVATENAAYLATKIRLDAPKEAPLVLLVAGLDARVDTQPLSTLLAEAYARDGIRTLLMGTNLRRPLPHVSVKQPYRRTSFDEPALDEMLMRPEEDLRPTTVPLGKGVALDVVTAYAPVDDASHVLTRGFARLLGRLQSAYEVIVVDAAPVLEARDALAMSPHAAVVVLVARVPGLRRSTVREAVGAFGPLRHLIIGIVALDVPHRDHPLRSTADMDAESVVAPDDLGPARVRPRLRVEER